MSNQPLPLSICMIVRNEAALLPRCLESIQGLASELIIVDTGSEDATPEIAAAAGAKVLSVTWRDDFAWARNQSLAAATQPWILVLDADETLDPAAREALSQLWPTLDPQAIYSFRHFVHGQGTWTFKQFLFANDPNLRYVGRVHEEVSPSGEGYRQVAVDHLEVGHWNLDRGAERIEAKSQYYAKLLRLRLADEPSDQSPHLYLARFNMNHQDWREAVAEARAAIAGMPEVTNFRLMAHLYGGIACLELQDWEQALSLVKEGMALYDAYPEFHAVAGIAMLKLGRLAEAEASLVKAIYLSRQPERAGLAGFAFLRPPAILGPLGLVFAGQGKPTAARICDTLAKEEPEAATRFLFHELSDMLHRQLWPQALWLITLFFPQSVAISGEAVMQRLNGPDELDRVLAVTELWSCVTALGRPPLRARELLEQAVERFAGDPRPLQRLGQLAILSEQWAKASDWLNRALALDDQSGWAWNALGVASIMLGDNERARECFTAAIQVGTPQDAAGARDNLARLGVAVG